MARAGLQSHGFEHFEHHCRGQSGCLLLPSGAGRAAAVLRRTSWNAMLPSAFFQATCAERKLGDRADLTNEDAEPGEHRT